MRACDIIKKKRDGLALTREELTSFLMGSLKGNVPDYQVSAFLMASFLRGLNAEETGYLTEVMLHSGEVLDLSGISGPKIDKHSTGGVGDKVSLILAPLVSAAGVIVPMMSGRGLGHTGGTLDKLESIPGFRTSLGTGEFKKVLSAAGCAMIGLSEELAPLDKKLYALRDVTATVESIPLITASIMSKKLSEGIDGLVLDVKAGSGAFMKDLEKARCLAGMLVKTGNSCGVRTVAAITDMDEPLGYAVGNSLEVIEAVNALRGEGPEDLMEVTLFLGALMLQVAGIEGDAETGRQRLKACIADGSAFEKFIKMVRLQGGDVREIESPSVLLPSSLREDILSGGDGYIQSMDAEAIGTASMLLGAGRETMEDGIDHSAGILLKKKVGDSVKKGEALCTFFMDEKAKADNAREIFTNAIRIGAARPGKKKMIIDIVKE